MDEITLQAMLDSGDPDQIEEAIRLYEGGTDVDGADSSTGAPLKADQTDTAAVTDTQDEGSDAEPKGVASKNGAHIIPFDVLEKERQENALLKQQLADRDREIAEARNLADSHQATTDKLALLQQQLEKEGIKPAELPSELKLTEAELEGLEEYGDIGHISHKLGHKLIATMKHVERLQAQLNASAKQPPVVDVDDDDSNPASVNKTIDQVDGLRAIIDNPQLAPKAIQIDKQLLNDPSWKSKPMKDRFNEVMRRMAPDVVAFERNKSGNKKTNTDPDDIAMPYSLNGIPGTTSEVTVSGLQQFDGLTESQIQERFNSMSDEEQTRALAALGW